MVDEVEGTKESANEESATPEHDTKMAERADQDVMDVIKETKETSVSKDGARPEWLPEKYKTVEDFLAGHKALEEKIGEKFDPDLKKDSPDESEAADTEDNEKGKQDTLDLDKYYTEYQETGAISEGSYKELTKLGFTKEVVDTYIDGYVSQVKEVRTKANDIVGGEDQYDKLVAWAQDTLTEEQLEAYNKQLSGSDTEWELALRGLNDKYLKSGDAPVERVRSGDKPFHEGVAPYGSQEEVKLAMTLKDASGKIRYRTDPSYRKTVEARLAISDDATMGVSQNVDFAQHG